MTVLMNVYFDTLGDIKAITPENDNKFSNEYFSDKFPISDVECFLMGQKNPFDYYVLKFKKNGLDKYSISKKDKKINLIRTLSNFLTKVSEEDLENSLLRITTITSEKVINLRIDSEFLNLAVLGDRADKDQIEDFVHQGDCALYFTKKDNPFHHLCSVHFNAMHLYEAGEMSISYDENLDLSNSSVYTKQLFKSYVYTIKENHGI